MQSSDFVDHLYDYGLNWTPLGPITIIYDGKSLPVIMIIIIILIFTDHQMQCFKFYYLLMQDGDYARMNSLTTELVEKLFEDVSTSHEAFLRGKRLSGQ